MTLLLVHFPIASPFSLVDSHIHQHGHTSNNLQQQKQQWKQARAQSQARLVTTRQRSSSSTSTRISTEPESIEQPEKDASTLPQNRQNRPIRQSRPTFHHKVSLPDSYYTQILSTDSSLRNIAIKLRQYYDEHFCDPRQPNANRFIWDPWFVRVGDSLQVQNSDLNSNSNSIHDEGDQGDVDSRSRSPLIEGEEEATKDQVQYSLKRIQSSTFFTNIDENNNDGNNNDNDKDNHEVTLFDELVNELTVLGRSIGLKAITPPWMSLYMDGDRQNLHTDAPQGQMAFVLSLCRDDTYVENGTNDFTGGETMLLRSDILDYWKGFDGSQGLECGHIMRFVPPTPLGRCIVFDPRIPHGVNTVDGTLDPRKGRVVIHGWFNEPEVCFFGPWGKHDDSNDSDDDNYSENDFVYYDNDNPAIREANQILEDSFQPLLQTLGSGEIGRVMGYLALRLEIDNDYGAVDNISAVCDTLRADWDDYRGIIGYDELERPVTEDAVADVRLNIYETLKSLNFGDGAPGRVIVVPFAFE